MNSAGHRNVTAALGIASVIAMYKCGVEGPEPYCAAFLGFATSIFVHPDLDLLECRAGVFERLFSMVVHAAIFGLAVWNISQANPNLDLWEFFRMYICRWIRLCQ